MEIILDLLEALKFFIKILYEWYAKFFWIELIVPRPDAWLSNITVRELSCYFENNEKTVKDFHSIKLNPEANNVNLTDSETPGMFGGEF